MDTSLPEGSRPRRAAKDAAKIRIAAQEENPKQANKRKRMDGEDNRGEQKKVKGKNMDAEPKNESINSLSSKDLACGAPSISQSTVKTATAVKAEDAEPCIASKKRKAKSASDIGSKPSKRRKTKVISEPKGVLPTASRKEAVLEGDPTIPSPVSSTRARRLRVKRKDLVQEPVIDPQRISPLTGNDVAFPTVPVSAPIVSTDVAAPPMLQTNMEPARQPSAVTSADRETNHDGALPEIAEASSMKEGVSVQGSAAADLSKEVKKTRKKKAAVNDTNSEVKKPRGGKKKTEGEAHPKRRGRKPKESALTKSKGKGKGKVREGSTTPVPEIYAEPKWTIVHPPKVQQDNVAQQRAQWEVVKPDIWTGDQKELHTLFPALLKSGKPFTLGCGPRPILVLDEESGVDVQLLGSGEIEVTMTARWDSSGDVEMKVPSGYVPKTPPSLPQTENVDSTVEFAPPNVWESTSLLDRPPPWRLPRAEQEYNPTDEPGSQTVDVPHVCPVSDPTLPAAERAEMVSGVLQFPPSSLDQRSPAPYPDAPPMTASSHSSRRSHLFCDYSSSLLLPLPSQPMSSVPARPHQDNWSPPPPEVFTFTSSMSVNDESPRPQSPAPAPQGEPPPPLSPQPRTLAAESDDLPIDFRSTLRETVAKIAMCSTVTRGWMEQCRVAMLDMAVPKHMPISVSEGAAVVVIASKRTFEGLWEKRIDNGEQGYVWMGMWDLLSKQEERMAEKCVKMRVKMRWSGSGRDMDGERKKAWWDENLSPRPSFSDVQGIGGWDLVVPLKMIAGQDIPMREADEGRLCACGRVSVRKTWCGVCPACGELTPTILHAHDVRETHLRPRTVYGKRDVWDDGMQIMPHFDGRVKHIFSQCRPDQEEFDELFEEIQRDFGTKMCREIDGPACFRHTTLGANMPHPTELMAWFASIYLDIPALPVQSVEIVAWTESGKPGKDKETWGGERTCVLCLGCEVQLDLWTAEAPAAASTPASVNLDEPIRTDSATGGSGSPGMAAPPCLNMEGLILMDENKTEDLKTGTEENEQSSIATPIPQPSADGAPIEEDKVDQRNAVDSLPGHRPKPRRENATNNTHATALTLFLRHGDVLFLEGSYFCKIKKIGTSMLLVGHC